MVYMHFPATLTEEEEQLQKKYAKLRKKKRAFQVSRAPKVEPPPQQDENKKRTSEEAAINTEQAKKLLKLGAIKVGGDKKEPGAFKRTKRHREQEKGTVGFQPFDSTAHSTDEDEKDESAPAAKKHQHKNLYESFTRGSRAYPDDDREIGHSRPRERRKERNREREYPKKGNTIYVYGHGIQEDLLRKTFANFGNIVNIALESDKNCGFVTFEKTESAEMAITQMDGSMVSAIQLRVSLARRQPQFDQPADPSTASWATIAKSMDAPKSHQDTRDLVTYEEDFFS